jgi:curved DNA-binding protein CbpA
MDYYVVLGIAEDADEGTVRSAFRALARRYHPDVGAGSSPAAFQRAREAYETLVDPDRRRQYDRRLHASRTPSPAVRHFREVVVPRPFAEPLVGYSRTSFVRPRIWVVPAPASLFDEIVEQFFASFADDPHWRRHGW